MFLSSKSIQQRLGFPNWPVYFVIEFRGLLVFSGYSIFPPPYLSSIVSKQYLHTSMMTHQIRIDVCHHLSAEIGMSTQCPTEPDPVPGIFSIPDPIQFWKSSATQLHHLSPLYWDLCIDHHFQHPENTEIWCSYVLPEPDLPLGIFSNTGPDPILNSPTCWALWVSLPNNVHLVKF